MKYPIRLTAAALMLTSAAFGTVIDVPPPPFADPPSPWAPPTEGSVVTFAFKTSWDNLTWNDTQLGFARDAVAQIDEVLPGVTFVESGDFTLRWGGADFFRDWRNNGAYNHPGWDLSGALAVAYKHNNGPWDRTKYPNNEIYFNSTVPWSFQVNTVAPNAYDFWTVALHEIIHMIACDAHATHPDEVMYESIGLGERKTLKLSDLSIIFGGTGLTTTPANIRPGPVVPEPAAAVVMLALVGMRRSRRS